MEQDTETRAILGSAGKRASVETWMEGELMIGTEYPWPGRFHEPLRISTRQYAKLVHNWSISIGLEANAHLRESHKRASCQFACSGTRRGNPVQFTGFSQ